jgi:outer membrane lipoprotein-sorting protein
MSPRPNVVFAFFALAAVACAADPLAPVFDRIDAASKTFEGLTADITENDHNAVVNEDDIRTGTIKLARDKSGAIRLLIEYRGSHTDKLAFDGHEGLVYHPKTNILDVFDMAKYQGVVNQYLALGFGASSADLKAAYDITWLGDEKIGTAGTAHLKLVPKSAETKKNLKYAELWYGSSGLIVQQKLVWPAGDYRMVTFSSVRTGVVTEKDLELKPKGATRHKIEQ